MVPGKLVFAQESDSVESLRSTTIVDGFEFPWLLYPSIVKLVEHRSDGIGICTGTFITSRAVVTAAHCVAGVDPGSLSIVNPWLTRRAIAVSIHPGYAIGMPSRIYADSVVSHNDIALVFTDFPYFQSRYRLSTRSPRVGQTIAFLGFGAIEGIGNGGTGVLRGGANLVEALSPRERLIHWTYDADGDATICHGDSGGPVFISDRRGRIELVGVVSGYTAYTGDPCLTAGSQYATAIAPFRSWINRELRRH